MTAGTGARLLSTEQAALLPILRRAPAEAFDRPTVCTGWTVRAVLAHCGCALTRAAEGRMHAFTPELNEIDVDERRSWPLARVLAELEQGYGAAAAAVTAADGRLDGPALGEWLHGGDVREALGEPGAYGSEGVEDALLLLVDRSRRGTVPPTLVRLPDRELVLGAEAAAGTVAAGWTPTCRPCSGCPPGGAPTAHRLIRFCRSARLDVPAQRSVNGPLRCGA